VLGFVYPHLEKLCNLLQVTIVKVTAVEAAKHSARIKLEGDVIVAFVTDHDVFAVLPTG